MVAEDANGAVWTGTYGGGLDRLDGQRVKHFRHDPKNPDSPANDNIASLVPDTKGRAVDWGPQQRDGLLRRAALYPFLPGSGEPRRSPGLLGTTLLLDQHGILWITASSLGLVRFDTHTRKFTSYLLDPTQPGSQVANAVHDIYSDGGNLARLAHRAIPFDPATGTFARHYTEKDGLASNSTVGILGDAQGNVWVSTVKGLSNSIPGRKCSATTMCSMGYRAMSSPALPVLKRPTGGCFSAASTD